MASAHRLTARVRASFYCRQRAVQRWSAYPGEVDTDTLARAGVAAEHALFIDDSLPNVHAAQAHGSHAHHFVDHHDVRTFLLHAGVLRDEARLRGRSNGGGQDDGPPIP